MAASVCGQWDAGTAGAAAGQSRAVRCCAAPSRAEPCRPAVGGPCRAVPRRYKAAPPQRWPRDAMCASRCLFLSLLLLLLLPLLAAPSPGVAPSGRPRARRGLTYPGTLWCGAGSNADSYEQLGKELSRNPPRGQTPHPSAAPLPSTAPGHPRPYPQLCPRPFIPLPSRSPRAAPLPERSPSWCCPTRSIPNPHPSPSPASILLLISVRSPLRC